MREYRLYLARQASATTPAWCYWAAKLISHLSQSADSLPSIELAKFTGAICQVLLRSKVRNNHKMCRVSSLSVGALLLTFPLQGSQVFCQFSDDLKTPNNGSNDTNTDLNVIGTKLQLCSLDVSGTEVIVTCSKLGDANYLNGLAVFSSLHMSALVSESVLGAPSRRHPSR